MKLCYLPVKSLRPNPDNFLPPLSDKEYAELKESIIRYGILDPLIVIPESNKLYTIFAGNYRHKIAVDIGLEEVPCLIAEKPLVEGIFDTEIFRRHLTADKREELKAVKEKICKEIVDKYFKENLLPEIYKSFKERRLELKAAIACSKLPKEEQLSFVQSSKSPNEEHSLIAKKNEEIKNLREDKKELKKQLNEYEEKIEQLQKTLDKAKENVNEAMKEEFQRELNRYEEIREQMVKQLRQKDEEIERLKEQAIIKEEKKQMGEIRKKAGRILETEDRKNYMVNVILFNLDDMLRKTKEIRERLMKCELPIKDGSIAREKIKVLIEQLRELLSFIRIEEREEREVKRDNLYS